MNKGEIITLVIIAAIIIIAIVVVIIWNNNENNTVTNPTLAFYNEVCVVNSSDSTTVPVCATGLTCVKSSSTVVTGVCKKNIGTACSSVVECIPSANYCFNGLCSLTETTGGLNQPPPCDTGFIVVGSVCKVNTGGSCSATADCGIQNQQCVVVNTNNPSVKICTTPKTTGSSCLYDDDCASLFCDPLDKVCSVNYNPDGGYGAPCLYYAANNQYINCQDIYSCQRDLALNVNDPTSVGVCLPPVISWPSNTTTNNICNSHSNSCIPPSICYNGRCVFPPLDYLSCSASDSTGGCLKGFTCENSTLCVPNSGYPGIGNEWKIVEWIRSANGQMGWWNPIQTLPRPGLRPSFSSYTSSTGTIFIYSDDVSNNSYNKTTGIVTYNPYYIVKNGIASTLTLNYVNSDSNNYNYGNVPNLIKFIPSNTGIKIGVLTRQYYSTRAIWYVMMADLGVDNQGLSVLTIHRPTYDRFITATSITDTPSIFNMDLRGTTNGRFLYNVKPDGNSYYIRECPLNGTTDDYTININTTTTTPVYSLDPPILAPAVDLQFITYSGVENNGLTQLVINTGSAVVLYNTNRNYGASALNKMIVTTYPSNYTNLEILFTRTINGITYLYYVVGENTVIMPIDINSNALVDISVMDSSLSDQLPNLYVLTTTV